MAKGIKLPSTKPSRARAAHAAEQRKAAPPKRPQYEPPKPIKPAASSSKDRSKAKANERPSRQLNFMDKDSDSGYDEAPAAADDVDFAMDISSALVAGPSSRPVAEPTTSAGRTENEEDEDEIMALMGKKAMKDATTAVKSVVGKGKGKEMKGTVGGGSWQSMGLHPQMLRSLLLRGFKTPTPIQRASIPSAIATPPRDLVGMARTGSGKTLAYMIPLLHRLEGKHSSKFGPRALVLCPGRELAFQILKVGKELGRGYRNGGKSIKHAGDDEDEVEGEGRTTAEMRWGLVVGGESLDEQFSMIASNPDVIIATPGRLLHLIVEMNLDLKSVEYVVFDEADRLFEMGFELQLHEILHRLPTTRQSLLFSATLPKSLVEFAKAGLVNPKLIRLDAETKISSDLKMAFLTVKPNEKEAALLCLLKDVIKVPFTTQAEIEAREREDDEDMDGSDSGEENAGKPGQAKKHFKRERMPKHTAPHQTLVFVATKHHVEYLTTLLRTAGYSTSHIYGSLDQVARKQQMDRFRRGRSSILVVTDVAARGIDIPVLENVINYDFPCGSRIFVHRVGRTARAGRQGWAWSFVTNTELPHLLDLQLFLGRPLISARESTGQADEYTAALMLGSLPRDPLDAEVEYINTTIVETAQNLPILKEVVRKGQAMYERSQGKASQESYRRAKEMMKDPSWGLAGSSVEATSVHPMFRHAAGAGNGQSAATSSTSDAILAQARAAIIARINNFTPAETVFEVGTRGKTVGAQLMQERRKTIGKLNKKTEANRKVANGGHSEGGTADQGEEEDEEDDDVEMRPSGEDVAMADEEDLKAVFEMPKPKKSLEPKTFRDSQFYMSHYQEGAAAERGYSLQDGQSFVEQARTATFDLNGDDGIVNRVQKASQLTWDRKKRKFIKGDGVGADNKKLIRSESGARLPASFKSGRFDEWKAKKKLSLPKVGESEGDVPRQAGYSDDRRYRHNKVVAPKPLDPKATTYEKKMYVAKKKAERTAAASSAELPPTVRGKARRGGAAGQVGQAKSELRSVEDIRKQRKILEQRRAKNARPSKKGKGKGKGRR